MKLPWSKFFWADWESDEGLRQCSLAAQGLWMRLLCICAKGDPRGYLTVRGEPLDITGIARAIGVPEPEAAHLMAELDHWGVFSRDRKGRIFSRRLVRDEKKSAEGRKFVAKRWKQDPETKDKKPGPNRVVDRAPKPQMLEARSQKEEKNANPATTEPYPESLTLHGEGDFKKIGLGSGVSGSGSKFGNQQARDEYAASELAKVVGWDVVMAAEDPTAPNHDQACRQCRAAAKAAGVGWVSPSFRNRESAA
jgi:hypothetical protein